MGPGERIVTGIVIAALAAGSFVAGRVLLRPRGQVDQPIAFNHSLHVESLECETCHELAHTGAHSGLPGISTCLMCHEETMTESAEEKKILELAEAGQEQVFRKLFQLPDNVYYSHRRHVGVAGIECAVCHGAIAQTERPPEAPLVRIDMDFCIECHDQHGLSRDCTRCHR